MKKNVIKKLAKASYTNDKLDRNKVDKVSKNLRNNQLKVYIKDLKTLEARNTIVITIPSEESINEIRKHFMKIYPNKNLKIRLDTSLITGIKVVDFDNEYELSLMGFLEESINSTND